MDGDGDGGGGGFLEDLETTDFFVSGGGPSSSPSCSICLELVLQGGDGTGGGGRSVAKLICGHEFHLDCIGSAFNAKGAMQCPNCRKVENGRWLYANGQRSSADLDTDGWIPEDYYDFHELPFALQWCPIPGFMQISSISSFSLEEEFQPNSYNEAMGSSGFGDHSSVPSSAHRCPYLAPNGFPHAMHSVPSSSTDHVPDNDPFHRYPTSFGGQSSTNIMNPHVSSENELRNQDWLQRPFTSNADQSSSHFGTGLFRIDTNSQQRAGSFTHSNPLVHGSHGSSAAASVMVEARAPTRGHGSHVYQQPVVGYRNPQLDPRRTRPRGNHHHQDGGGGGGGGGDSISSTRHLNHIYGWGREQFTSLPWIPIEGESQWWSPFNPNLNLRSSLPTQQQGHQRAAVDNGGGNQNQNQNQSQSQNHHRDNGYHRRMPPGMPPFI